MKNNALAYSLKVWLTALIAGSIALAISFNQSSPDTDPGHYIQQMGTFIIITGVVSGAFSIPSLTVLLFSSWGLCNVSLTNFHRKFILTGVGILSCLLAFFIAIKVYSITLTDFGLLLPYFVAIVAGIWFYKLKTDKEEPVRI